MSDDLCPMKKAKPSAVVEERCGEPPPPPCASPSPPTPPTHSTRGNGSLRDFIRRDVEPEGVRLLLPFLTTRDRLTLSECSQALHWYRTHLSRVRIVEHPAVNARLKRGLITLLGQQRNSLSLLHIDYLPAVAMLDQIGWSCCHRLGKLDLSAVKLTNKDAACVGRALSTRALRSLHELVLSSDFVVDEITSTGIGYITQALAQGVCPSLHRLVLSFGIGSEGEGVGEGIGALLESSGGRSLRELDFSRTYLGPQGGLAIARALEAGACPDLQSLELSECHLAMADGQALGRALRSGACPKLTQLSLGRNPDMRDEGTIAIMEALTVGSCPHLQRLDLAHTHLTSVGGAALSHVLSSGMCSGLRSLDLFGALHDRQGSRHVLEAIKQGAIPNLRHLNLSASAIDLEHIHILGDILTGGACPSLEALKLSFNPFLGDEGVMHLAEILERGGGPKLKQLEMTRTGTGPAGAAALAKAVTSGSLRNIQDLFIFENEDASDKAVVDTMKAIGSGVCPELHWLYAAVASVDDETGREVMDALCHGSWPHLRQIVIREKPPEEASVWGLKAGMRVGGQPGLRGLTLCVPTITGGVRWLIDAIRAGACPALKAVGLSAVPKGEDRVLIRELEEAIQGRLKGRGVSFHAEGEDEEEREMEKVAVSQ